jgi:VWFA-related protein
MIERVLAATAVYALLLPGAYAQQQSSPQQATPPQQQAGQPPQQQQGQSTSRQQTPPQTPVNLGQAPPPPPSQRKGGSSITVHSNLVQIDTFVTDKDGKPIKGLKKENFDLDEDGKRQTLNALDYFDIEGIEKAAKSDETKAPIVVSLKNAPDPEVVREQVRDHRMIVLFFDMTSMQPEDLLRATDSAKKFIHDKMSPADIVAIVSFGTQLVLNTDFTNDRDVLYQAVQRLIPGKDANLSTLSTSASDTVTADDESAFSADDTEFNIFNTDRKLFAMETLSGMLGGIPGKKSVMQFTGGITQSGEDNRAELIAATNAANKNNVSFYTVDSRGLLTDMPDATAGATAGNAGFTGGATYQQTQSRQDSRDTLSTLAEDTGGKAFFDEGDLGATFAKVESDNTGYYLISYYSTDTKEDGRYRRVHVKLVGNFPGAHLRYREGYNASKTWKIYTTEDREKQLDDAMASDVPRVELPIALETNEFRLPNNSFFVPISAKLAPGALKWAESHGKQQTQFDFLVEVTDAGSKRIAGTLRDTITIHLDTARFQQVQQQSIVYQGNMLLTPGKYTLKFLARENESGRIGTFEEPLNLTVLDANHMALSSVVLSSQVMAIQKNNEVERKVMGGDLKAKDSPLDVNGERIIPSVTRVFTDDQTMYVFFQAYLPQKSTAGNLRAGLIFFRNGRRLNDTPMVEPAEVDEKTHTASFRISLPLSKLSPGGYTVEAVVIEAGGTQAAFSRNYFALRKPTPAAPAAGASPSGQR